MLSGGPDLQLSVRIAAPLPEFPDQQLISGVVLTLNGDQHGLVIDVTHLHSENTDKHRSVIDGQGFRLSCLAH